jgi:hypothetical protein
MNFLLTIALAACSLSLPNIVIAQTCANLPEGPIAPVTFDQAIASLSGTGAGLVKDEFETTAQFEARRAAATVAPSSLLVSLSVNPEYVSYNADTGSFAISPAAVANLGTDWSTVFLGSPHYSAIEHSSYGNIAIVLSSTSRANGTYIGQNAYNASWEITRVNQTVNAIFESKPRRYASNLWWGYSSANSSPTWNLPVPFEQAREFESKLRAAVLIAPRAPFFFENTQPSSARVTIQNPFEITQTSRIIVADIQCVVFTDDANNVLLLARTN